METIEYISHSCILVDTGDCKILMDPWFRGSAYCNQWHLFPKAISEESLKTTDVIMISHGHEDHLHRPSLSALPKTAHVYFPYLWVDGIRDYLGKIGFTKITEAVSMRKYVVSPSTTITFMTTSMDTAFIIESNGKVLVNLNDSLNSLHENIGNLFVKKINHHWPKINYLFTGLGGAGYFPNTVHVKSKDDLEVGKLREQLLVNNFCKLVRGLHPEVVFPFVPGFVLLNHDKTWINETKFPRELLTKYYKEHFEERPSFEIKIMYPGDIIKKGVLHKISPYHREIKNNSLNHLINDMYAKEIEEVNKEEWSEEYDGIEMLAKLKKYVPVTAKVFTPEILETVNFCVCLNDLRKNNYFNIEFNGGECNIYRSDSLLPGKKLVIRTKCKFLNHSLDHKWGGDVFIGGYAADIDIIDETAIEQNLDIACLRLLMRYPLSSSVIMRDPVRAIKYFSTNPLLAKLSLKQRLFAPKVLNKIPYNERNRWLNKTKCEICQACDLPLLSYELGEQL